MVARLARGATKEGIRPLNPARDLGPLANLIENAFGEELTDGGAQVLREIRLLSRLGPLNYLLVGLSPEADSLFNGLVWEQDGRLVGNVTVSRASARERRWQISNVAVLDRFRRRGIGRQLVEAAIDDIARQDGRTAYLYVRDDNPSALSLYRGLGFVEVDRLTDLALPRQAAGRARDATRVLRPLKAAQGDALHQLVQRAEGAGRRWLYGVRRWRFTSAPEDRFLRWLAWPLSTVRESRWGVPDGASLAAGLVLRAARLWNRSSHQLQLWVHPDWRGQLEEQLADDILILVRRCAPRAARVTLPACEARAAAALQERGFGRARTLILMRVEV